MKGRPCCRSLLSRRRVSLPSWLIFLLVVLSFKAGSRNIVDGFHLSLPIRRSSYTKLIQSQPTTKRRPSCGKQTFCSPTQLRDAILADYSSAATALFDNMKTPASILAAGMISIGFLAPFQIPPPIADQPKMVKRVKLLKRAYILVTLISFCSELLAVMWATVAVNQLTERSLPPAESVWDLLQRDCDLSWAAVNSHFVVGLVGFMYMVGIRGYVMLLAAEASEVLIVATLSGVGSALLLMVSVVNRGVESGGGDGIGYGATVLDLFGHYVYLLYQRAVDRDSFGPLELSAIVLEAMSVAFALYAILLQRTVDRNADQHTTITEQRAEVISDDTYATRVESVDMNLTSSDECGTNNEI